MRLLTRTTRGLRPTAAGQAFFARCRRALAELAEAECAAHAHNAALSGALRLAAPPAFGRAVLLPRLAAFAAAHPAIALELQLGEPHVDLVAERVDLAVRLGDPGRAPDLIHTRLCDVEVLACAAPAYLTAHGAPRRPADLSRHTCLVQAAARRRDVWTFRAAGARNASVAAGGGLRSNDVEALAVAARAGMGIARLPDFLVAADLERGSLQRVLPRWSSGRIAAFAVYAERRHLPARVRALLDHLVAHLR